MGTRIVNEDLTTNTRRAAKSNPVTPEAVVRASRRLRFETTSVEPVSLTSNMLSHQADIQEYLQQLQQDQSVPTSGSTEKAILLGAEMLSSFGETVISHPSLILRRQCQASVSSSWYHLTPFTLMQPVYYIQKYQGLGWMTKGLGSVFIVRALQTTAEATVGDITGLPREIHAQSSLRRLCKHLLLKFGTALLVSPFYTAAFVESVQSGVASEPAGLLDVLIEGMARLSVWHSPATGRLLPLWSVAPPLALLFTSKYCISSFAQHLIVDSHRRRTETAGRPSSETSVLRGLRLLHARQVGALAGGLLADALLFPAETVLHRLLLQGSRVLLDNVDTGVGVVPAYSDYDGLWDCIRSTFVSEGISGFYKGFGALLAQYMFYSALLRVMGLLIEQFEPSPEILRPTGRASTGSNLDSSLADILYNSQARAGN